MNARSYLQRIGYEGPVDPTYDTLVALERAHMLAVPFENLDIHRGRRLVLEREANYAKIVERRRGGWCYELNGMFSWLLETLGYPVTLIGSRVEWDDGHSRDLAHMLMLVDLDQPYLVDVGFGYGSVGVVPLAQAPDGVIAHADGLRVALTTEPRELADFQEMCDFQQTSSDSNFVRTRVCSKALPGGYLRLRELVLTEISGGAETARELSGEDEWLAVLRDRFGVEL